MTKTRPTKSQKSVRAEQRAHGDSVRSWLQDRLKVAAKAHEKARKKRAKKVAGTRGVDRVPERYRVTTQALPQIEYRRGSTYVDPARDAKSAKAGRLRRDEPAVPARSRPKLRRAHRLERRGRQVFGDHPWRLGLELAKARTPSQWLNDQAKREEDAA